VKAAKRELKVAVAGSAHNDLELPLFLKAYAEYVRDNFHKSHALLAAVPNGPNRYRYIYIYT